MRLSRQIIASNIKQQVPRITLRPSFSFSTIDQKFLRLINFDANYLTRIPWIFQPLEPLIIGIRDQILVMNSFLGLPWWSVLALSALFVRLTIFPLILVQTKRFSKIGPVSPVLVYLKEAWKFSELSFWEKLKNSIKIYRDICKQQNFRFSTIFVYNIAYYPLLISMIFGVRKLLTCPELEGSTFLWITNFTDLDPYYILPTLTIALYYFNFERFITPQNQNTLLTKIRIGCQFFLILWYPFLCNWPSGIVLYMCSNALVSVLQTSLMKSRWWAEKMNQKIIMYTTIMQTVEYDKGVSESIIQGIRKGEENFDTLAVKETLLLQQTVEMLKTLEEEQSLKDEKQEETKKS